MSYQQPEQPRQGAAQQAPQQQMTPAQQQEAEIDKILEELLGGEIPGTGYLFADEPRKRDAALIPTDPDRVRAQLLRAIETMAIGLQLPYGAEKKAELGKAILECGQTYLLLDPTVDQSGVPVGAQATAEGAAQEGVAQAQAQANEGLETHKALMAAHVAAHASGQGWSYPVVQGTGHALPPRVKPNPAEEAVAQKNKPKSEELKGARGDRPLPRPRVGG